MNDVKQVIVMRTHYPNDNGGVFSPRKGKLIAQGAHAAMMWLSDRLRRSNYTNIHFSTEEIEWLKVSSTKICLQVNSEEELLAIYNKAKKKGLTAHLVTDSGKTEFAGVPTRTCLAIGPNKADKIDEVTKELKLY
jgi:peptidyl-tRNA hydrolase, PTH2 family